MAETIEAVIKFQTIPTKLTADKVLEYGKELAEVEIHIADLTINKKEAVADFNESLKVCREDVDRLSQIISTGKEEQEVEVEVVKDFAAGTITTTRTDTHAIVEARKMTTQENQRELQFN